MGSEPMAKGYGHAEAEGKWYTYWEERNLFSPEVPSDKEPYCIVIPPPNVTGSLHMGHALNNTLQDIMCRYKRMKGYNVLWQPGTDHAGIATQNVVEKDLAAQGTDRHQIGREKFIELVWEWKKKYGGLILNQLRRLGCSCDWGRERFTMDEGLSRAVKEVFVQLYKEGLIYRGDYIINWCPRCLTALADIEVEHEQQDSFLYYIRYSFEDGGGHLVIATTRPETLLGDTAVAVNPNDERYVGLSGRSVLLPILNKPIPVIFDEYVDTGFGTGALKITPAHDLNDFEIGNTHGLERISVIDEHGLMNEKAGPYAGMDRFACRDKIVHDLKEAGLVEKIEPYQNAVGHCYRCKTMIEPLLSKQWFVRTKPLAEKAIRAVKKGRTRIFPASWEAVYYDWMSNIRDWCVSRQIWWGHRIPAWYCMECNEVMVAMEAPSKCAKCGSDRLRQEEDVLDTWFSSGLWPFSTLGWPDETPELKTFYPTSLLVTGFDILFFWVARMMMMGIHFLGEVPFKEVYIHALVRDAEGKKMSKSKGNVIDPLEVMDEFGTDAFRFTLAAMAAQGRDVKLSEERIMGYRHFVNKLWNAARFVLMNLDGASEVDTPPATLHDRWISAGLNRVSGEVTVALDEYRFNDAATACYQFVWHEFCDWYLEMAKLSLYHKDPEERNATAVFSLKALKAILALLHPFMPFVTEDIWQKLPGCTGSIMEAPFPEPSWFEVDETACAEMNLLRGTITAIRNVRGEIGIPPSTKVNVVVDAPNPEEQGMLEKNLAHIVNLARVENVEFNAGASKPPSSATAVFGHIQVHVLLKGVMDFEEEKRRLTKEIKKLEKDIAFSRKKLENEGFLSKAPADVIAEVKEKVGIMVAKRDKLVNNVDFIKEMEG
ncbi:MAG: valine--tRNA ligase [Desulfatiglandaceae bacterium]